MSTWDAMKEVAKEEARKGNYKDLRELRLQVDQLKRKILVDEVQTTNDDEMLKRLNKS